MRHFIQQLPYRVARFVPYKLRYYVVINAWVDATTGEFSNIEAPSVTVSDALKAMK